jgi:hypothetical protein
MEPANWLRIAYAANILILTPVVPAMLTGRQALVFEGKVMPSEGLALLVGSLWAAILAASVAGLAWPRLFAPVLLIQILYKTLWLVLFVLPLWRAGGAGVVPWGVAGSFIAIVAIYPFLFWLGTRG